MSLIPENIWSASDGHKEVLWQDWSKWKCTRGRLDSFPPDISLCIREQKEFLTCKHCNSCNGSSQPLILFPIGTDCRKGSGRFACSKSRVRTRNCSKSIGQMHMQVYQVVLSYLLSSIKHRESSYNVNLVWVILFE